MKKIFSIFLVLTLSILSLLSSCSLPTKPSEPLVISEGLEYKLNEDGNSYSVIGFGTWQGLDLVIPNEYNGLPVTAIGDWAFGDQFYLLPIANINKFDQAEHTVLIRKVVIPTSVTTIGVCAFFNCIYLESVSLPNSITNIEPAAFFGCTSLTSITIPNSVETIGALAFGLCTSLRYANIPASVSTIEDASRFEEDFSYWPAYAFFGCSSLERIDVDKDNKYYTSISNNLYSKDGKTLIQYAQGQKDNSFTIPDHVENISMGAFTSCKALREVTLSPSMTKIEQFAFMHCHSLSAVNIPLSVTSIESDAFSNCYSLTSITIPESVTFIGDDAFSGCYSLIEICNKSSVNLELDCRIITDESESYLKRIEDYVFYDDGTNIYLVKYVGNKTELTLPKYGDSLPYGIYDYAFYNIGIDPYMPITIQIMAGQKHWLTSITIPDYVVSIGKYAFNGCNSLKSIYIPESVTQIDSFAFAGCRLLAAYCETRSAPEGWNSTWNRLYTFIPSRHIPTVWNYKTTD